MYTKSHNLDRRLCNPHIRLIRTTDLVFKDHMWPWWKHPDGKLVLIARQVVLLTRVAKFCRAIKPPCCAKEPSPPEASSYLDTDFTAEIMRF